MSAFARLSRFAVLVSALAVAGCSGTAAETPPVATLQSAAASPSPAGDQRPVFPLDATADEKKALTKPWADCMAANAGPRSENVAEELLMKGGVLTDDPKVRAALKTCLPEQPEAFDEHQRRTDLSAYKDNQREWYRCAQAAGYELTSPDPETGQFGLAEVGPEGDFDSPAIQECRRKAFTD